MVGEHSSKQYDQELEAIRSKVLLMGGMVETQFDEAVNAFRVGNTEQADKVVADDHAVNQLEVQLDDACSHLIVRRQPAANDLRTIMATIKVITDLERIGDESSKIARTAKRCPIVCDSATPMMGRSLLGSSYATATSSPCDATATRAGCSPYITGTGAWNTALGVPLDDYLQPYRR